MDRKQGDVDQVPLKALSWLPLAVAALNSYGPVTYNYGFALYFLNYRHGFVKRGLVGEFFAGLSHVTRGQLLAIEYSFLAVAFGLTYVVFRGMLFGTGPQRRLVAVLLCGPALLPHIGYLFAQPDVTLYILLLVCLAMFVRWSPAAAASFSCVLCCIGLLAHEAFSLMFYPLPVAILLHLCIRGKLRWWAGAIHVGVVFAAFAAVVHCGGLKIPVDSLLQETEARTDVRIQRQVFDVMASSLAEQIALVRRLYTAYVIRVLALTAVLSIPYFVLLGQLLKGTMKSARCGTLQRIGTGVLFLLPLLLCALGHDASRWIGAACIDATLFILFLYMSEPPEDRVRRYLTDWARGPWVLPWLAYLIAVGPYGATGLRSAEQLIGAWFGP